MCILMTLIFVLLILYCRFEVSELLLKRVLSDKIFGIDIKNIVLLKRKMGYTCMWSRCNHKKKIFFFNDCG